MKFLVPNYSCLQNPLLRGYCPQIPVLSVLCPQMNLLDPPRKKFLGTPLVILRPFKYITTKLTITVLEDDHVMVETCSRISINNN